MAGVDGRAGLVAISGSRRIGPSDCACCVGGCGWVGAWACLCVTCMHAYTHTYIIHTLYKMTAHTHSHMPRACLALSTEAASFFSCMLLRTCMYLLYLTIHVCFHVCFCVHACNHSCMLRRTCMYLLYLTICALLLPSCMHLLYLMMH